MCQPSPVLIMDGSGKFWPPIIGAILETPRLVRQVVARLVERTALAVRATARAESGPYIVRCNAESCGIDVSVKRRTGPKSRRTLTSKNCHTSWRTRPLSPIGCVPSASLFDPVQQRIRNGILRRTLFVHTECKHSRANKRNVPPNAKKCGPCITIWSSLIVTERVKQI